MTQSHLLSNEQQLSTLITERNIIYNRDPHLVIKSNMDRVEEINYEKSHLETVIENETEDRKQKMIKSTEGWNRIAETRAMMRSI